MKHEVIICSCNSPEHQFIFSYIDDDYAEGYLTVHLCKQVWYKRLWIATKYVFGFKSEQGAFEEIVLNEDTAKQLIKGLKNIKS